MQISADIVYAAIDNLYQDVRAISSNTTGDIALGIDQAIIPQDPGGDLSPATAELEADNPHLGAQLNALTVGAPSCSPLSFAMPTIDGATIPPVALDYCDAPDRMLFRDVLLVGFIVWYLWALVSIVQNAWTRSK